MRTGPRTNARAWLVCLAGAWVALMGAARPRVAVGHELAPALLSIEERAAGEAEIVLRLPGGAAASAVTVAFSPPADVLSAPEVTATREGRQERLRVALPGGLGGRVVRVEGAPRAAGDVLVRVAFLDGRLAQGRLRIGSVGFSIPRRPSAGATARAYLGLGVEHILSGLDHLLFVIGVAALSTSWRALVKTISAFTAAHSLTLVLAALGLLRVPGPPVEATIALSIVFVAREMLEAQAGRPGLGARRPWLVAFGFGLLHGLGFAGALAEVGLPQTDVPLALGAFNVGVEIGQLAFVAVVIVPGSWAATRVTWPRGLLRRAPAYVVGSVAAYLCVARVASF